MNDMTRAMGVHFKGAQYDSATKQWYKYKTELQKIKYYFF